MYVCELLLVFAFHARMMVSMHTMFALETKIPSWLCKKSVAAAAADAASDDDVIFLRQKSKIH